MSRVGNKPIKLIEGVNVTINPNNHVVVKGPKGEQEFKFNSNINIKIENGEILISRPDDSIVNKELHGTTSALIRNMIHGVTVGFSKALHIEGVGYRVSLQGNTLVVAAGYSHLINKEVPAGLKVDIQSPTDLTISGIDKQLVGQFAADIRSIRKPEPYLGKGIRYKDEHIRRKEGKKAK